MTKHFCDLCGKEEERYLHPVEVGTVYNSQDKNEPWFTINVCKKCAFEIIDSIKERKS